MNERIGTFCEKCREVVCRCAENEANLKKAADDVVSTKPSEPFGDWVKFMMDREDKLAQEKINTAKLFEVKELYGWDKIYQEWFNLPYEVDYSDWLKQNYKAPKKL